MDPDTEQQDRGRLGEPGEKRNDRRNTRRNHQRGAHSIQWAEHNTHSKRVSG